MADAGVVLEALELRVIAAGGPAAATSRSRLLGHLAEEDRGNVRIGRQRLVQPAPAGFKAAAFAVRGEEDVAVGRGVVLRSQAHDLVDGMIKIGAPAHADPANLADGVGLRAVNDGVETAGEKDPLYDEAVQIVIQSRKASISYVQRNLRIGYNRAARIIEDMEKAGLVTPMQSNGNREIITSNTND